MPDYGSQVADKTVKTIENRIKKVYSQARKDLKKELDDFTEKFKLKDEQQKALWKAGAITKDQYDDWRAGQVFIGKQWKAKINHCTDILADANAQALNIVNGQRLNVFAENANHTAYQLEKDLGMNTGFGVYNASTVQRLLKEQPELLPRKKLDNGKDKAWNRVNISQAVTQGIISGQSIDKIAQSIADKTASTNMKAMTRYARTAVTGAENAGRIETLHRAQDMGINVKKQWLATLDSKTRDSHQYLDGQIREVDEPFKSLYGSIRFPGDPEGEPGDVYNCRCTLVYILPDVQPENVERYDQEEGKPISDMTYEEWAHMKGYDIKDGTAVQNDFGKSIEDIKKRIAEHQGEWKTDELISVGKDISNVIDKSTEEKVGKLQAEYDDLIKRIEEAEKTGKDNTMEYYDMLDRRFPLRQEIKQAKSGGTLDALKQIRPFGGVTDSNVSEYANLDYYSYKKKLVKQKTVEAMNYYPSSWLETSKNFGAELRPHWTSGRAYYGWGEIRFSDRVTTNIHELGHRMEHCKANILEAEKAFYKKRTDGLALEWLGKGYDKSEKARRDDFIEAYMGKDYGGSAFELVSMGFESVLAPHPRYDLTKDQEMRNWILGILSAL